MASGNSLLMFGAWTGVAPATVFATLGVIQGTTTIKEIVRVANFDDTIVEYLDFSGVMPEHYAGGGLTCTVIWTQETVTTAPTWGLSFRRVHDNTVDIDTTAGSYTFQTVTAGTISAAGMFGYDDITFTSGSQMDSVVTGDFFVLRCQCTSTGRTGDARLLAIHVKET